MNIGIFLPLVFTLYMANLYFISESFLSVQSSLDIFGDNFD